MTCARFDVCSEGEACASVECCICFGDEVEEAVGCLLEGGADEESIWRAANFRECALTECALQVVDDQRALTPLGVQDSGGEGRDDLEARDECALHDGGAPIIHPPLAGKHEHAKVAHRTYDVRADSFEGGAEALGVRDELGEYPFPIPLDMVAGDFFFGLRNPALRTTTGDALVDCEVDKTALAGYPGLAKHFGEFEAGAALEGFPTEETLLRREFADDGDTGIPGTAGFGWHGEGYGYCVEVEGRVIRMEPAGEC